MMQQAQSQPPQPRAPQQPQPQPQPQPTSQQPQPPPKPTQRDEPAEDEDAELHFGAPPDSAAAIEVARATAAAAAEIPARRPAYVHPSVRNNIAALEWLSVLVSTCPVCSQERGKPDFQREREQQLRVYAAGGEAQAARVTGKEPEPEQEPGDDDDDGICFGADPATVADTADDDIGGLEYAAAQTGGKKKRRGHRNRQMVRSQPATCNIWPIAHSLRVSRRMRR